MSSIIGNQGTHIQNAQNMSTAQKTNSVIKNSASEISTADKFESTKKSDRTPGTYANTRFPCENVVGGVAGAVQALGFAGAAGIGAVAGIGVGSMLGASSLVVAGMIGAIALPVGGAVLLGALAR